MLLSRSVPHSDSEKKDGDLGPDGYLAMFTKPFEHLAMAHPMSTAKPLHNLVQLCDIFLDPRGPGK